MRKIALAILTFAGCPSLCLAQAIGQGPLPLPLETQNAVELCLNSRYSQHSLRGTATPQQLGNVLWAAGRAPVTGAYRRIFVVAPTGTFLYDPNSHSLSRYSNEVTGEGAFAIRYEAERAFDAGVMFMSATLAAVSLRNSPEAAMATCPKGMGLPTTRLFFGVQPANALTSTRTARGSVQEGQPGWLPDPATTGSNIAEEVFSHLSYGSHFMQASLTPQQLSQVLWAGYGCSAHTTSNGRAGLTVPSAMANYYLTRSIYVVNESGVYRYLNRNPATSTTTQDHRLEAVTAPTDTPRRLAASQDGNLPADARPGLRAAVAGLPPAPCYVVLCLDSANAGLEWARLETGFVAGNILIQATALGLGCHFRPNLSTAEQKAIQTITHIPFAHLPQVIVSVGTPLQGDANQDGMVDLGDFVILSTGWLASKADAAYDSRADFNRDGLIAWQDLAVLAANWLASSPTDISP